MSEIWRDFLETALGAADAGCNVLRSHLGKIATADVDRKRTFDYVTQADRESEQTIINYILDRHPNHLIYAEESTKAEGNFRWIIDPLDGTTNFIHAFPVFAVSIALEVDGRIVVGVIGDPTRGDRFWATRGGGAFLNGQEIRVSQIGDPSMGLLTTGFPFRSKEHIDRYLESFKRLFLRFSGIRRLGAVALDFAYLAAGRCEGFWEIGLAPWDIAAGSLLIEEAGGRITDFADEGSPIWTGNVIASNGLVHGEIVRVVRDVFGGVIDR